MRALEKTIVILAFLALVSQSVRHAYMLWFQQRGSVLDKYDKPHKAEINAATSLDELMQRYEPIRKQVDELNEQHRKTGNPVSYVDQQTDLYKSENELRQAITGWEEHAREIHELRFFWIIGLMLLVLGVVMYHKFSPWFGLTLVIAGLAEFVYWTSPTFFGGTVEFDRLLRNKLGFSLVSLVLLIIVIRINHTFADKRAATGN